MLNENDTALRMLNHHILIKSSLHDIVLRIQRSGFNGSSSFNVTKSGSSDGVVFTYSIFIKNKDADHLVWEISSYFSDSWTIEIDIFSSGGDLGEEKSIFSFPTKSVNSLSDLLEGLLKSVLLVKESIFSKSIDAWFAMSIAE